MKFITVISAIILTAISTHAKAGECGLLDQDLRLIASSETRNLCHDYDAKLYLIVNTASECAFTPQYEELEELHRNYSDRGLLVVAFPSNDFLNQEPGEESDIQDFCETNYNVTFPLFAKTHVIGESTSPLYQQLAEAAGPPRWNFYKYLVNRQGEVVKRYSSITRPNNPRFLNDLNRILRETDSSD
jgi:glutathione peroxidase